MATLPPGTSLDAAARERIEALVALFQGAERRLAEIERGLRWGTYRRWYLRARLREAREIIDGLLLIQDGRVTGAAADWAAEHFPATYGMGAGMAVRDLREQAVRVVRGDPRIHTRAVDALLNRYLTDATEIVVKLHANTIRSSRIVLAQAGFGEDVASGIIGGLPRRETSRALERSLRKAVMGVTGDEVDFTHVEIGGRSYRLSTWAEMHARTETARASTAGTRVLSAVNGVLHVQITSHAHAPCICTPFEGRIYRMYEDRGDPRFPWIGEVPGGGCPMHPNCVHREAPAVIDYLEERGDVAGRARIPTDFVGLSDAELARLIRANRDRLERFSRDRDGMLPETFRLPARLAA
jgi:hypothetical protein